jgi:hypothetical protein
MIPSIGGVRIGLPSRGIWEQRARMFSTIRKWLSSRKELPPPVKESQASTAPDTPDALFAQAAPRGNIALAWANGTTTSEEWDTVELLREVVSAAGINAERREKVVQTECGFVLTPGVLSFKPHTDAVQSTTIVRVEHPTLIPRDAWVFEYQHSIGETFVGSLRTGFIEWERNDFRPLRGALQAKPDGCLAMEMTFPDSAKAPERKRRVVFGPATRRVPATMGPEQQDDPAHPFCDCCLFHGCADTLRAQIEGDGLFGIRMFVARSADGSLAADCRVNGQDYSPGQEALIAYAKTWPGEWLDIRKQYVVIHSLG